MQKKIFSIILEENVVLDSFFIEETQLANCINQKLRDLMKGDKFPFVHHVSGDIDNINDVLKNHSLTVCYGKPVSMTTDYPFLNTFSLLKQISHTVGNIEFIFYRDHDSDTRYLCRIKNNYKLTQALQKEYKKRTKEKDIPRVSKMFAEMIKCKIISLEDNNPIAKLSTCVQYEYAENIVIESKTIVGKRLEPSQVEVIITLPNKVLYKGIGSTRSIAKRFAAIKALENEVFKMEKKRFHNENFVKN